MSVTTTAIFEDLESEVRSYCRRWPIVFDRAVGSKLYDESGDAYIDFFSGAGSLNYGHNNPLLKQALLDYIASDRIVQALDMYTVAKREFLDTFDELILRPRGLDYRVQFPGPGGANAVEAALKLARRVTARREVVSFTNGFHGMTLGALAATSNPAARAAAGVPLSDVTAVPYDSDLDGVFELEPAAVIVETVQGEGGVNPARPEWLRELAARCESHGVLLIVDDIQMGCGRTGPFFSFEVADIVPDIVCLSKSLSGYGLPLAVTLIRPDLDIWRPGEHNGTFRGFNPSFVTATAALRAYWSDDRLECSTRDKGGKMAAALAEIVAKHEGLAARGRGMVRGLVFDDPDVADEVSRAAFSRGLLVELAGPRDEVVKLMPPLTTSDDDLERGLARLAEAVDEVW